MLHPVALAAVSAYVQNYAVWQMCSEHEKSLVGKLERYKISFRCNEPFLLNFHHMLISAAWYMYLGTVLWHLLKCGGLVNSISWFIEVDKIVCCFFPCVDIQFAKAWLHKRNNFYSCILSEFWQQNILLTKRLTFTREK